jgi:putative FmdB family regulatory protein
MPLYEYQCEPCGHRFEVIQKFSDAPPVCPKCGGPVEKQVSSPAIQFKGSGFYLTDYGRGGKSDTAPSKDGKASAGETAEKGDKGDKGGTSDAAPAASSSGDSSAGKSSERKSGESKPSESKSSESKPAAPPAAKGD